MEFQFQHPPPNEHPGLVSFRMDRLDLLAVQGTLKSLLHSSKASILWCSGFFRASLVAQRLKRLPAMWETLVRSLGWEDPLEKEMATHSKCSSLENPMDRGAWRATVHGATESRTQLSD